MCAGFQPARDLWLSTRSCAPPHLPEGEGNLLNLKFVGHLFRTLLLTLLVFFNSCGSTSTGSAPPVSAGALLREYQQSSTWVRQKYDGKEISVRGLVMSAIVLPGDTANRERSG